MTYTGPRIGDTKLLAVSENCRPTDTKLGVDMPMAHGHNFHYILYITLDFIV